MDNNIKKVAVVMVCTSPNYWQYAKNIIESSRKFFIPHHKKDYYLWTDMPEEYNFGCTIIPTEATHWPYPTLMRYHLFLQMEEKLKEYDYIFYVDADMVFVGDVGDEIFGEGLTMAQHPMYALRREYIPPYEPNPNSQAYIPRLGRIMTNEDGKIWFEPLYAAGGFQGGKAEDFIKAMKTMKRAIDIDLSKNYIAIWNDESHWNRYLASNPPSVVLDPGYIYPDNLIPPHMIPGCYNEIVAKYYRNLWGRDYTPRLVTITKKFSLVKGAGQNLMDITNNL